MTRDDVIRMAREAGDDVEHTLSSDLDFLGRFASIVAAAERDRMCEQFNIPKELVHEKAKSNEANRAKVLGES